MADDRFDDLPTDVFVEILLRLPTISRRRSRLVCKRWRDAIDERTSEMQSRSKILALFIKQGFYRAYVFHDEDGRRDGERMLFPIEEDGRSHGDRVFFPAFPFHMVGSCNGLICLRKFSTILIVNPVTGMTIQLPPEASPWAFYDGKYSFAYHPTTGKYKVVHVSSPPPFTSTRGKAAVAVVNVFTLDDDVSPWREVPVVLGPADSSDLDSENIVSVDGSTYWLTRRRDRVLALDLEDERVTSFDAPPVVRILDTNKNARCYLTNVQERLGMVIRRQSAAVTRLDVWVLEGGGRGDRHRRQPCWRRRYSLFEAGGTADHGRWITTPRFTHGKYVLSTTDRWLFRRNVDDLTTMDDGKNAELWPLEGAECLMEYSSDCVVETFAYSETLEP